MATCMHPDVDPHLEKADKKISDLKKDIRRISGELNDKSSMLTALQEVAHEQSLLTNGGPSRHGALGSQRLASTVLQLNTELPVVLGGGGRQGLSNRYCALASDGDPDTGPATAAPSPPTGAAPAAPRLEGSASVSRGTVAPSPPIGCTPVVPCMDGSVSSSLAPVEDRSAVAAGPDHRLPSQESVSAARRRLLKEAVLRRSGGPLSHSWDGTPPAGAGAAESPQHLPPRSRSMDCPPASQFIWEKKTPRIKRKVLHISKCMGVFNLPDLELYYLANQALYLHHIVKHTDDEQWIQVENAQSDHKDLSVCWSVNCGDVSSSCKACYLQIYCLYTYAHVEFCSLAVMSYDRYLAICCPLQYHTRMTFNKALIFIAVLWFYSFVKFTITLSLNIRLTLCGNIIHSLYCRNYLVVKLACSDTRVNNFYGIFGTILTVVVPLLPILFSYVKIFQVCFSGSKQTRQKAASTCTPHLISLLNFSFGCFFEIRQSRFHTSGMPSMLRIILSLYILIIQPLLNPIMYGLQMSKIRNTCKHVLCYKLLAGRRDQMQMC
ncbi:hypothetical protein ABVT39_001738 [Epinephelus coioides]